MSYKSASIISHALGRRVTEGNYTEKIIVRYCRHNTSSTHIGRRIRSRRTRLHSNTRRCSAMQRNAIN